MEKFIVTPKEDKSVTMTIRIDRALQEEYNDLAAKTNRSRNELISMALQYALDHMELKDEFCPLALNYLCVQSQELIYLCCNFLLLFLKAVSVDIHCG